MAKCSACNGSGRCRPCRGAAKVAGRPCGFCVGKPFSRAGDCLFCKGRGHTGSGW